MHNAEINARLAARTASLLADWAGLAPGRKVQFGHDAGLASVLMLASGSVRSETPSTDAVQKMTDNIFASLSSREDGAYLSFSTDYGPDHRLSALANECGIRASWPSKSMMSVSKVYGDGSGANSVSVSTGYRSSADIHYLTDSGWIVSHVNIPHQLHALVIKGIASGEVPDTVAIFQPF